MTRTALRRLALATAVAAVVATVPVAAAQATPLAPQASVAAQQALPDNGPVAGSAGDCAHYRGIMLVLCLAANGR